MSKTITIERPFDGGGSVLRVYIIVHQPGRIPDKKIPTQTDLGVSEFLIQLEHCMPKGTTYTVVELVWTGDIWVKSGAEWLCEHRAMTPRKFAKLKRETIAKMKQFETVE